MANTWDTSRVGGGTYEFQKDTSGNYTLNSVGFKKLNKLNLPELKAEATTTTTKDTATASAQTKQAFGDVQPFYYDQTGKGGVDTQYTMKKEGDLATDQAMTKGDTFAQARQRMTTDAAYRGVTPSDRQPGFAVANLRKQEVTPTKLRNVKTSLKTLANTVGNAPYAALSSVQKGDGFTFLSGCNNHQRSSTIINNRIYFRRFTRA